MSFIRKLVSGALILIGFAIFGMGFTGDLFYITALARARDAVGLYYIVGLYSGMIVAGMILVLWGIRHWRIVRLPKEGSR